MFLKQYPQRGKTSITDYRKIISEHLPFVLAGCAKYTASSRLAQIIAVYVFICAFRVIPRLTNPRYQTRFLIEMLLEIVGGNLSDGSGKSNLSIQLMPEKITESVTDYIKTNRINTRPP